MHVRWRKNLPNTGGGLRSHLSNTYNAVLTLLPWQFHTFHLTPEFMLTTLSNDLDNSKNRLLGQETCDFKDKDPLGISRAFKNVLCPGS